MKAAAARAKIGASDIVDVDGLRPLAGVRGLAGVRVYDVGQGDGIAILGLDGVPVMQFDYGGRQGNPFSNAPMADVDFHMPAGGGRLLMISHWDEDHWCSAPRGQSAKAAQWLVPRQITSPRAVKFSAGLPRISCIPEDHVGQSWRFEAENGDAIWWEKIAPAPDAFAREEDCNRTGVALSVVKAGKDGSESGAILLPGDAPFDRVGHYRDHFDGGLKLKGLVAFHHGAGTHWTKATEQLLRDWSDKADLPRIIFSCSNPNAYEHPQTKGYDDQIPGGFQTRTAELRGLGLAYQDILF